ncbi:hypothetical protein P4O66_020619 [Electrophorus voltai]|uniref:C-C motif chemokine n=1 Tax=Electrophorus voltai TaxID=2609070 RepID=A0AAD8ZWC8_9TELE|nr:hypothetical protein P4O66_020619 [Electrophorus voltai]
MSAIRLLLLSAVVLLSTVALTEGMCYGTVSLVCVTGLSHRYALRDCFAGMRYRTGPKSCCFEFTDKPIKLNNVRSYKLTSQQCNKEAVLFTMKKGLQVCARTTDTWVQQHIKVLQSKMVSGKGPL